MSNGNRILVYDYANLNELLDSIQFLNEVLNMGIKDFYNYFEAVKDAAKINPNMHIDEEKRREIRKKHKDLKHKNLRVLQDFQPKLSENKNVYIHWVLYIFQQCVSNVYQLHKMGYAHLDISVENFVLHFNDETQKLEVKLIDYGQTKSFPLKNKAKILKKSNNINDYKWDYKGRYGKAQYATPELYYNECVMLSMLLYCYMYIYININIYCVF